MPLGFVSSCTCEEEGKEASAGSVQPLGEISEHEAELQWLCLNKQASAEQCFKTAVNGYVKVITIMKIVLAFIFNQWIHCLANTVAGGGI